jgi:hypothetical protein
MVERKDGEERRKNYMESVLFDQKKTTSAECKYILPWLCTGDRVLLFVCTGNGASYKDVIPSQ